MTQVKVHYSFMKTCDYQTFEELVGLCWENQEFDNSSSLHHEPTHIGTHAMWFENKQDMNRLMSILDQAQKAKLIDGDYTIKLMEERYE